MNDYYFAGSCCKLETISENECRISVLGEGDCLWTPRCGLCSPTVSCNTKFVTASTSACSTTTWDPFLLPLPTNPSCSSSISDVFVENFALSASSPVPCETIIAASTFQGSCCSLMATEGNGCVLNVVNGRCVVSIR